MFQKPIDDDDDQWHTVISHFSKITWSSKTAYAKQPDRKHQIEHLVDQQGRDIIRAKNGIAHVRYVTFRGSLARTA